MSSLLNIALFASLCLILFTYVNANNYGGGHGGGGHNNGGHNNGGHNNGGYNNGGYNNGYYNNNNGQVGIVVINGGKL